MRFVLSLVFIFLYFCIGRTVFAGTINGYNGNTGLGVFSGVKCSSGTTCTKVGEKLQITASPTLTGSITVPGSVTGDGTGTISGFNERLIAATATTITASQCGSTFFNTGAVIINLPEASTATGCKLTFVTANATNFDINPDDADQILVLTNALGDAIRNATVGDTVTLEAINASQWVVLGQTGVWTDIN